MSCKAKNSETPRIGNQLCAADPASVQKEVHVSVPESAIE